MILSIMINTQSHFRLENKIKKICFIVGTTKALVYSIHNLVVQKRNTRLNEILST